MTRRKASAEIEMADEVLVNLVLGRDRRTEGMGHWTAWERSLFMTNPGM